MTNYYDLKGYYTSSEIKEYLIDPISWEGRYYYGRKVSTAPMQLGTLAHQAILEPEAFAKETLCRPDGIKLNTKAGKEWKAQNSNKTVLDAKSEETINGIIRGMEATPCTQQPFKDSGTILNFLRSKTKVEQEFISDGLKLTEDFIRPVKLKCDAYWMNGNVVNIIDVKTTSNFGRPINAIKLGRYDAQAAWYGVNMMKMLGAEDFVFSNLFVETAEPYRSMLVPLPTAHLKSVYQECLQAIVGIESARKRLDAKEIPHYREQVIFNVTADEIKRGW